MSAVDRLRAAAQIGESARACYDSGILIDVGRRGCNRPARGTTRHRRPVMQVDTTPIHLSPQAAARFWPLVDVSAVTDCWPWTGERDRKGYGRFVFRGKSLRAHRVAYTLSGNDDPLGLCVIHNCDNPACCNPDHLTTGTYADNNLDRHIKGRDAYGDRNGRNVHPERYIATHARGERRPETKLTESQVVEMRTLYASGEYLQYQIADMYGIRPMTAGDILRGERWAHVGGPIHRPDGRRWWQRRANGGDHE